MCVFQLRSIEVHSSLWRFQRGFKAFEGILLTFIAFHGILRLFKGFWKSSGEVYGSLREVLEVCLYDFSGFAKFSTCLEIFRRFHRDQGRVAQGFQGVTSSFWMFRESFRGFQRGFNGELGKRHVAYLSDLSSWGL